MTWVLCCFVGIVVSSNASILFISQLAFSHEILTYVVMAIGNPYNSPHNTKTKLSANGDPFFILHYIEALHELCNIWILLVLILLMTCNLFVSLCMTRTLCISSPLKHILYCLKGTLMYVLHIRPPIVDRLVAYSDAKWSDCPTTRWSTYGFVSILAILLSPGHWNDILCLALVLKSSTER